MVKPLPKATPLVLHPSLCVGCHYCQVACSFIKEQEMGLTKSRISVVRVGEPERYDVFFNDDCDWCGFCVKFCFYGAILKEGTPAEKAAHV